MTTLRIRLPESLHQRLKDAVQREGISMNQFITLAVAEKLSAIVTEEYLAQRAQRGTRERYLAALAQVPDVEPEEFDHIGKH